MNENPFLNSAKSEAEYKKKRIDMLRSSKLKEQTDAVLQRIEKLERLYVEYIVGLALFDKSKELDKNNVQFCINHLDIAIQCIDDAQAKSGVTVMI